jgi:hypothetical protein
MRHQVKSEQGDAAAASWARLVAKLCLFSVVALTIVFIHSLELPYSQANSESSLSFEKTGATTPGKKECDPSLSPECYDHNDEPLPWNVVFFGPSWFSKLDKAMSGCHQACPLSPECSISFTKSKEDLQHAHVIVINQLDRYLIPQVYDAKTNTLEGRKIVMCTLLVCLA